jgi:hypothetical protein
MSTEKQNSISETPSSQGGVMSPCPFCGLSDLDILTKKSKDGTVTWYRILHGPNVDCSVSMLGTSKESLLAKWNFRHGS